MQHVAILKASSGLLEKILSGEKQIESRWYYSRFAPWDRIVKGEKIYFKYSGKPVKARAVVKKVLQFANLTPSKVKALWLKYGKRLGIEQKNLRKYIQSTKNKKYCILMFLGDIRRVKSFRIDKRGYGNACAWITVGSIVRIKKN